MTGELFFLFLWPVAKRKKGKRGKGRLDRFQKENKKSMNQTYLSSFLFLVIDSITRKEREVGTDRQEFLSLIQPDDPVPLPAFLFQVWDLEREREEK